jgi:ATP-dependent DNA helicase RecG
MLTKDEMLELIQDIESSRAERTVSVNDTDKFCEAVCAFANDMPDSKQNGYLLVGVHDDGCLSGIKATYSLLKNLAAIRFDRDYRSTGPTMFYQYADRIELLNSGGLYGRVNRENFPDENDYRNPIIADAMRTLGYVNRFGRGIGRVRTELIDNGNGEPLFDTAQIGSFRVSVGLTKYAISEQTTLDGMAESSQKNNERAENVAERAEKNVERAENEAECTEKDMERAEKVKAWALNMIPSGVRQDARSNMASVMAGIGMDEKITTEGLMHLTGLSDRGVRKTISALKAFGLLVRVGSDRAGHWEVVGFDP